MDFGAFLEMSPGVDGLLHVVDMSYARVGKASDVVKVGDELEVKVLKVDPATRKIALGLKQLQEDPWTVAARTFKVGDRVSRHRLAPRRFRRFCRTVARRRWPDSPL